jgi:hypothetical protein
MTFRQKSNENSKITFDLNTDEVNIADQIRTPFFTNHTFTVASLNEDSGVNPALTPRVISIIGALDACRLKNDSLK